MAALLACLNQQNVIQKKATKPLFIVLDESRERGTKASSTSQVLGLNDCTTTACGLSLLLQCPKGLILGFRSGSLCWDSPTGLQLGCGVVQTDEVIQYLGECSQKVNIKCQFPESVSSPMVLTFLVTITKFRTAHLSVFWLSIAIEGAHCTVEGMVVGEGHPWLLEEGAMELVHYLTGSGSSWGPETPTRTRFSNMSQREDFQMPTRALPTLFPLPAYFCLSPQSPSILSAFSI